MRTMLTVLLLLAIGLGPLYAQNHTQTIRGTLKDIDSQQEIIGAHVAVLTTEPMIGTVTDFEGNFRLEDVPVGRHNIQITFLGYEPIMLNSIQVTSGKELVLQLDMQESAEQLDEVEVTAEDSHDKSKPLNEMALVSARSFSIEEAGRYAAAFDDPARMAQNYAGVSIGGADGDGSNEIIVRGNSARGILWRMEGIEIPNPNHFAQTGSSGGAVSMLSSNTLATSDFFTGAFPSEYGNAYSGVFDLNLRTGNNEQREFAFMIGVLGIEASAEGYFSKKSKASYLVNYRYSTLGLLKALNLSPVGEQLPNYSDLSFKINIPAAKAGTFSLWGLGGMNDVSEEPVSDSTDWEFSGDKWGFRQDIYVGTVGLSHKIMVTKKSFLKTVLAASIDRYEYKDYWLDVENDYNPINDEYNLFNNSALRANITYTHKINAKNTIKAGVIASHLLFNFDLQEKDSLRAPTFRTYLDNEGSSQLLQSFISWKFRPHKNLTINSGMHYTHFTLNNSFAIEPRLAMRWNLHPRHAISAAGGLHSKPEYLAFYFLEDFDGQNTVQYPNKEIDMLKSVHAVLGYDFQISRNLRLKVETYYQHLYDVPVEDIAGSTNSIINVNSLWDVIGAGPAVNEGIGRNIGLDVTFEKFFSDNYYFLITGSVFDSKYRPKDSIWYNTRFNSNYQLSLLGGKEFNVGKNKNNTIGVNGKFLLAGGNRHTPIDLAASRQAGYTIYEEGRDFEAQMPLYLRFDMGINYKINAKKVTHMIALDIQNVTNRQNVNTLYYDAESEQLEEWTQMGIFPVMKYRITF